MTDENQEAQSAGDEISSSSDGKLFVTSNTDGTVRVWNFAYLTVIYQLSSTDLVTGLAFSPERRFFDIRGSCVNAWEPNSLIRLSETEDCIIDVASEDQSPTSVSHISEASVEQFEAATVIAAAPGSHWYCVGNEEGSVDLYDTRTDRNHIEITRFGNFLRVEKLIWSPDATHVAAADLAGVISVQHLRTSPISTKGTVELQFMRAPQVDLDGRGIQQMLFNDDSTLLLIISEDRGQIWSLSDETVIAVLFEESMNRRWLQHPRQKSKFLGFGTTDVRVFQWQDFSEQPRLDFKQNLPRIDIHTKLEEHILDVAQSSLGKNGKHGLKALVSRAMLTQDNRHVLVQIKSVKRVLIFDSSSFVLDEAEGIASTPLQYAHIPPDIQSGIEIPLGILSGSRLAFLNQDLWFCTYKLKPIRDYDDIALQRHYFIPRDWTSTESVEQCCMTEDGTLLCPKDDSVAVIQCNLEGPGF